MRKLVERSQSRGGVNIFHAYFLILEGLVRFWSFDISGHLISSTMPTGIFIRLFLSEGLDPLSAWTSAKRWDSIEAESWAGGWIMMGGTIGRATTSLGMGIPAAKAKRPANTTIITFTIKSMLEVCLLDASPFTKELSKLY